MVKKNRSVQLKCFQRLPQSDHKCIMIQFSPYLDNLKTISGTNIGPYLNVIGRVIFAVVELYAIQYVLRCHCVKREMSGTDFRNETGDE